MNIGRLLIVIGLGMAVIGVLTVAASKLGFPRLGKLPGDIVYRGKSTTVYFPIVTCIVVSALLTLVAALFGRR